MTKFSNILKVPFISECAINFLKKLYNKSDLINNSCKNIINNFLDFKRNMNVIIETTSNDYKEKNFNELNINDKNAILTLNVIDYLPNNILDFYIFFF